MKVRKYEGNVREMVGKLEESCGPILARCLKKMCSSASSAAPCPKCSLSYLVQ